MAPLHPLPVPAARKPVETQPQRSHNPRIVGWSLGLILLLGGAGAGVAYALGYFGPDPAAVAVKQEVQAKMEDRAANIDSADNKERFSFMKDIGEKIRGLPKELQKPLMEQGKKMVEQHMKDILNMPPDQQTAAIDKDLDLIQMMMKEGEKRRAERDAANSGGKTDGAAADAKPPAGSAAPNDAGAPPRGPMNHNQMLSSTTGETRAQWHHYIELLHTRAVERGISMPGMGSRQ